MTVKPQPSVFFVLFSLSFSDDTVRVTVKK